MGGDKDMDTDRDGRWLSYAGLAEIRGINKSSAMKLALHHKWKRRKDNGEQMQVYVPGEWLSTVVPRENRSTDLPRVKSNMDERLAKLTDEILQKLAAQRSRMQQLEADVTAGRNRIAMLEGALMLEHKARKLAETARDAAEAKVRELEIRPVRSLAVRIQTVIRALRR